MPLPLFLGIAAAVAGCAGVGLGVNGGMKMKKANDKLNMAEKRNKLNQARLERMNHLACSQMDKLGKNEIQILSDFKLFSELFEKIQNKPEFKNLNIGGVEIPKFEGEEIKKVSVGAGVLVGGLGGAALGAAGGYAAAGATTAAVMALGTASTGTAIASLSGAAATNATLAALGGGSLAAGGGGMALGTTMLGAATLGVGLLVGGVIFNFAGSSISGKADQAWEQMLSNERQINTICRYLSDLSDTAVRYNSVLIKMKNLYHEQLQKMQSIVDKHLNNGRVNWNSLSDEEKTVIENMVLIVSVLYNMCKVKLVKKRGNSDMNEINTVDINKATNDANKVITEFN